MIDQGNGAEIMYPELYHGMGLTPNDLSMYDSLLVGFDSKMVVLIGQIRLPVTVKGKEVLVEFIVVDAYSLYIAILAWPWLYAMQAIPSSLHLKIKFPIDTGVKVIKGDQAATRRCNVGAITQKNQTSGNEAISSWNS